MSMGLSLARVLAPVSQAPGSLSCAVVTGSADAEPLRPAWTRLLERSQRSELTQSPDWLLTWWRVYGGLDDRRLRLGVFHAGDRLVGLAPLLARRHWYRGCIPFRRLEFLASGEPAEHGIYSNHLNILAERGAEAIVAARLADALCAGVFGAWDELVLPMMSGDTAMPEHLATALQAAGLHTESTTMAAAPYITLPETWDAYRHGLSPGGRRNLERPLKALEKWSGGTVELECISAAADIERGKEILIRLHHDRWTGTGDKAGVFRYPTYLRFHEEIMRRLADRGDLEMLILRARGEPIAALYCMVWQNKVYAYQTGRRADVPTNVRPGAVIMALAIRRAIERGRREFDLLADAAFYKSQLTPTARPLVQVRAARRSFVETIRRMAIWGRARFR